MSMSAVRGYLRQDRLPHIWCPGCGNGIVLGALVRAIDAAGLDRERIAVVSGIGCSSRATTYLDFDTLHTTHGRALAFATGLKLARPDLKVLVLTGDGDLAAIGGNHFIHAARRNLDLTCVCFNNSIYGMTSGQYSPMTPKGMLASTAPYGHIERAFDLCDLARASGATYVARSTAYHTRHLIEHLTKAMTHEGFAFVEVVTQCPVYYGRKNRMGSPADMLRWQRDHAITVSAAKKLGPDRAAGKILIGEFVSLKEPEYTSEYRRLVLELQERKGGQR